MCKITVYVVANDRDAHVPVIDAAQRSVYREHKPESVIVGVAVMSPGYLIEIDAIAVVD